MEDFKYDPLTHLDAEEAARSASLAAMEAAANIIDAAGLTPVAFDPLPVDRSTPPSDRHNLDLLLDVSLPIAAEVGRTQMSLDAILDLVPGSVIALDKKAAEPVDLRVNGKLVARGEVVLVDDAYGIRITQIVEGRVNASHIG